MFRCGTVHISPIAGNSGACSFMGHEFNPPAIPGDLSAGLNILNYSVVIKLFCDNAPPPSSQPLK